MKFRIVSGTPQGFFACSDTLDPQKAASVFLSITKNCFPQQLDSPMLNELSLREYVDQPGPLAYIIYVGDPVGWKIALVPANGKERMPTAN